MSRSRRYRFAGAVWVAAAGIPALIVVQPLETVSAATLAEYVVTFDHDVDVVARARTERALGNAVDEVFSAAVNGLVATLDPSDVRRLRSDDAVVAVEANAAFSVTPPRGRYIVRLRSSIGAARAASTFGAANVVPLRHAFTGFVADLTEDGLAALTASRDVLAIEPDVPVSVSGAETPPGSWGLDRIDQRGLPLDDSFEYPTTGSGVKAYVLDTGVRPTHAQFAGRVESGLDLVGDGRGSDDCNGHGTHVAGTIAGATVGVARSAAVVPVRVLDCDGRGWMSDVIAGIDWLIADHEAGQPAVANLSLSGSKSAFVNLAIARGVADGVVFVVAAGNANDDSCNSSPASEPIALTVGASSRVDKRASFSNWGPCIDLFAPGVGITSAYFTSDAALAQMNGTSMAAPHVAGAAAVVLSAEPTLTPAQVSERLVASATNDVLVTDSRSWPNKLLYVGTTDSSTTTTSTTTSTTVPPTSTTTTSTTTTSTPTTSTTTTSTTTTPTTLPPTTAPAPVLPGPPRGVLVSPLDSAVAVSWLAPVVAGIGPVTYTATVSPGGATCVTTSDNCVIGGLANGQQSSVVLTARNEAGEGPASDPSVMFTPRAITGQRLAARTWGLDRIDQRGMPLDGSVVRRATGRGVSVYVLDSGVNRTHDEFGARVESGRNTVEDAADTTDTGDCFGHGTHVAGTIGGRTFGVAPEVSLVPVKVLDCSGFGTLAGIVAGIDWMVEHHEAGDPAVANLSFGGDSSVALNTAVARAVADGITVVVAAGNLAVDACSTSPGGEPLAITVGATNDHDVRASYSNIGPCVDVFAPGSDVRSAGISSTTAEAVFSGTSMAAPHVAGAAVLLLEATPTLAPSDVSRLITAASTQGVIANRGEGSPDRLLYIGDDRAERITPVPGAVAPGPLPVPGGGSPMVIAPLVDGLHRTDDVPRLTTVPTTRPRLRVVRVGSDKVIVRLSGVQGTVELRVNGRVVRRTTKRVVVLVVKGIATKRITARVPIAQRTSD